MTVEHDMVVVGAGWYGLAAAKIYIELHPGQDIVCLEASGSCGGTWSKERIYPGLHSNNLLDTYEYPDFPMSEEIYGVKAGQHIPGAILHRYLTDFAKKFGVYDRMQFNTRVESLRRSATGGWTLTCGSEKGEKTIATKRIILATGLTSSPNIPNYPGADKFGGPIFHSKDFYHQGHTVQTAENAVVVGGGKSAYDVAWAYANAGAKVDLIIRPDGNGPVWISYPWVMGGMKRLEKLITVRFLTWFSPCPWIGEDGFSWPRRFLHGTAVGRWMVDRFWSVLGGDVITLNGYNKHPELKKLLPWNSPFWIGSGLSIHNYPTNFFDMIKQGKVRVRVAKIDHLSDHTVHLSTGEDLRADVVVSATGWRKEPSMKFIDFGPSGIGLGQSPDEQKLLSARADQQILTMFPRLKNQPTLNFTPKEDPFRLYRFMIPPTRINDRNIAFSGLISAVSTAMCAYIQALWISAYFDDKLDRKPGTETEVTQEVMLHTQWGKWRYPTGYGASLPDFVFDALPYLDSLLNDMSLKVNRKKGRFNELFSPYSPRDYYGIVDEWVETHGKK